jgi:uncharacterized membrane protein (UPF0127 family)
MASRLLVIMLIVAAGCTSAAPPSLSGFDTTTISIDDRELVVAVADTSETRRRGLMGVTDLGGLDGMLFIFEADSEGGFWMSNTLIQLDIAFFASDGIFVDKLTMVPCTTDDCPRYHATGPYRYAIEAPEGDLGFVTEASALVVEG